MLHLHLKLVHVVRQHHIVVEESVHNAEVGKEHFDRPVLHPRHNGQVQLWAAQRQKLREAHGQGVRLRVASLHPLLVAPFSRRVQVHLHRILGTTRPLATLIVVVVVVVVVVAAAAVLVVVSDTVVVLLLIVSLRPHCLASRFHAGQVFASLRVAQGSQELAVHHNVGVPSNGRGKVSVVAKGEGKMTAFRRLHRANPVVLGQRHGSHCPILQVLKDGRVHLLAHAGKGGSEAGRRARLKADLGRLARPTGTQRGRLKRERRVDHPLLHAGRVGWRVLSNEGSVRIVVLEEGGDASVG
mmetsp:Transcript_16710/g.52223  ORF Transcript_16710/g.52223 Transcript_16710/m.52223 type:complete len:298 (+) Transcript_16710:470-1363(+)